MFSSYLLVYEDFFLASERTQTPTSHSFRLPVRLTEGKTKANKKETLVSQSADPQSRMKLGTPGYSNETCRSVRI